MVGWHDGEKSISFQTRREVGDFVDEAVARMPAPLFNALAQAFGIPIRSTLSETTYRFRGRSVTIPRSNSQQ